MYRYLSLVFMRYTYLGIHTYPGLMHVFPNIDYREVLYICMSILSLDWGDLSLTAIAWMKVEDGHYRTGRAQLHPPSFLPSF